MRLRILLFGMLCLLLFLVSAARAELVPVPIEGMMLVSASDWVVGDHAYFMEGSSDNTAPAPLNFFHGDISPHLDEVLYVTITAPPGQLPTASDIWIANIDGSNAVNVTYLAGVEGSAVGRSGRRIGSRLPFSALRPGVPARAKPSRSGS